MDSAVRSTFAKILVAAVVISSFGIAMAHEGHTHAPSPAPVGDSAAAGLLPVTIISSFVVAATGFFAVSTIVTEQGSLAYLRQGQELLEDVDVLKLIGHSVELLENICELSLEQNRQRNLCLE
ncbi:hypothetical protein R1sor_022769 [Riccia sorocarpa]|uniref:Uncharacterized protein n=1 Tax=Riccia sorocarpa TaxID=122646 RepID=A0ABD3GKU0_9MARC